MSNNNNGDNNEALPERTKKREPGKIYKALKLGVVGDGTVGKTTLLMSYTMNAFLDEYTPTVFDNFSVIEDIDGRTVNIICWDTAGQEDYKQLRTTTYTNTDIFMVCFSVVHPSSFDNIKWWLHELKKHCPNTPFVLCGTKIDLREDPETLEQLEMAGEAPINYATGKKKAKEIKARKYIECTAKDPNSAANVFIEAAKVIMDKDKKMRADNAKKAKKEDKKEAKMLAKIEKLQAKQAKKEEKKKSKKIEIEDPDELEIDARIQAVNSNNSQ